MSENQEIRTSNANSAIKNYRTWSMGAGFIPIPDLFAVSVIQPDMMRQLCKVHDIILKKHKVKQSLLP